MRWIPIVILFALLGCGSDEGPPPGTVLDPSTQGKDLVIEAGGEATVPGADLRITFREVLADSRCPIGVECIWAGDGVAALDVEDLHGGGSASLELHTNPGFPTEGTFGDYRIELIKLDPYPEIDVPIEGYVVTLRVEKAS
jgi:hypothetical protein